MADLGTLNTNRVYTEIDSPVPAQIIGVPTMSRVFTEIGSTVPSQRTGATLIEVDTKNYLRYVPWHFQEDNSAAIQNAILNGDVTGTLSGIVKIQGEIAVGVQVALFERRYKQLLARQRTKNNGSFTFSNLLKDVISNQNYFIVVFDNDDEPILNAKIYDYLTPV